jgi:hypothetical protein
LPGNTTTSPPPRGVAALARRGRSVPRWHRAVAALRIKRRANPRREEAKTSIKPTDVGRRQIVGPKGTGLDGPLFPVRRKNLSNADGSFCVDADLNGASLRTSPIQILPKCWVAAERIGHDGCLGSEAEVDLHLLLLNPWQRRKINRMSTAIPHAMESVRSGIDPRKRLFVPRHTFQKLCS